MSPLEILDEAQSAAPGLGLATVYRTVRSLSERGDIVPVEIPGEPPRYEVAGKRHHHHFRCRACGRVFEVMGCPGRLDRLVPDGFQMESHELVIFGVCEECASGAKPPPQTAAGA